MRIDDLDAGPLARAATSRASSPTCARSGSTGTAPSSASPSAAALYERRIERLRSDGLLYECWCTRAEIRKAASAPHGPHRRLPRHLPRPVARPSAQRRAASGRPPALRVRAGAELVGYVDRVHGPVEAQVDDFVVRRGDGAHAYNLAVVVDDADQGVGEVVRGDDLLEGTPRQIWLQRRLGLPTPGLRARAADPRRRRRSASPSATAR